jgi:thiol-disulfide isomerase/thioredoxin
MTNELPDAPAKRSNRRFFVLGAVAVGLVAGYFGVAAVMDRPAAPTGPCAPAVATAKRISPLIKGEVAALTQATKPLEVPDLNFDDGSGQARKLSDFRGKTVLLNLWATWCVPCRKEMPALNELQTKLGSDAFQVIAINIDTRDAEKPKAFLTEGKLTALDYFTDKSARVFQDLKSVGRALGMPTSVLIDPKGCEIATIAGPAEWASGDAVALIEAALKK